MSSSAIEDGFDGRIAHQVSIVTEGSGNPDGWQGGRVTVSWFELAWLAERGRIAVTMPVRAWLESLAAHVRAVGTTPSIATTAAGLPGSFRGDPADRLIYAAVIEQGWQVVTKDRRLRDHRYPRPITIW